jgi:hypothetical protein
MEIHGQTEEYIDFLSPQVKTWGYKLMNRREMHLKLWQTC